MADEDNFGVEPIANHAKPYTGGYHIYDRQTKSIVGKAKTLRSANRMVDRRDNAYGAYRYYHKRMDWENG